MTQLPALRVVPRGVAWLGWAGASVDLSVRCPPFDQKRGGGRGVSPVPGGAWELGRVGMTGRVKTTNALIPRLLHLVLQLPTTSSHRNALRPHTSTHTSIMGLASKVSEDGPPTAEVPS